MKLKIEITMDNAAFEDDPGYEIKRILEELARKLSYDEVRMRGNGPVLDFNGNNVGRWLISS